MQRIILFLFYSISLTSLVSLKAQDVGKPCKTLLCQDFEWIKRQAGRLTNLMLGNWFDECLETLSGNNRLTRDSGLVRKVLSNFDFGAKVCDVKQLQDLVVRPSGRTFPKPPTVNVSQAASKKPVSNDLASEVSLPSPGADLEKIAEQIKALESRLSGKLDSDMRSLIQEASQSILTIQNERFRAYAAQTKSEWNVHKLYISMRKIPVEVNLQISEFLQRNLSQLIQAQVWREIQTEVPQMLTKQVELALDETYKKQQLLESQMKSNLDKSGETVRLELAQIRQSGDQLKQDYEQRLNEMDKEFKVLVDRIEKLERRRDQDVKDQASGVQHDQPRRNDRFHQLYGGDDGGWRVLSAN